MKNNYNLHLLNALSDAALLVRTDSPKYSIAQVNEAHLNITGYNREELLNHGVFDIFTDNLQENNGSGAIALQKSFEKVIQTGKPDELPVNRFDIVTKGSDSFVEKYWSVVNSPVYNESGEVEFILHTVKDVTEKILIEKEFEKKKSEGTRNEALLDQAEEMAGMGYWELDLKTNSIFWSDGVYAICDYKPKEFKLTFESALGVIHPDDRDRAIKEMQRVMIDGGEYSIKKRFVCRGKRVRDILSKGRVIKNEDGEPVKLIGVFMDITERLLLEKSEEKMAEMHKKAEKILQETQSVARIGGWEVDLVKNELYWSSMIKTIHEVESDFVPTVDDAIQFYKEGENRETIQKAVNKAISEGTPFDLELEIITAKGNERWVRATGKTEMKNGECVRIYGSTQDITQLKKSEEKLVSTLQEFQEQNEFITTALKNIPIGIAVNEIDTGHTILYNDKFCEIYGWPAEYFKDVDTFFECIYPDPKYRKMMTERILADLESGDENRMGWSGIKITTQSGEERFVKAKNIPLYDQNLMISTVLDITEQVHLEKELKQLSLVASKTTQMVIIMDPEGKIVWVNNAFTKVTEYKLEEVVGKKPGDFLVGAESDPVTIQRIRDAIDEKKSIQAEILNYTKTGKKYWADLTADPVLNDDGECVAYIAIEEDVTVRKQRDLQLLSSLKEKEVLLSEIHHRVKNNLAVVSSMMQIQMLNDDGGVVDYKLIDSISRIKTMATIHELLYQSGSFSELNFSEIIDKLISSIHKTFSIEKKVDINIDKEPIKLSMNQAIPSALVINEVVTNIFKHAFKDIETGKIDAVLKETDGLIELQIQDNGSGMPPNFDKENSTSIGMHIIDALIAQLEGDYSLNSSDRGTSFTMSFQRSNLSGIGHGTFS